MKLFLDTAHPEIVQQWAPTGIIDGITTNPTSLSKIGGNPLQHIEAICKLLPHGEISVEVTQKDPDALYKQARAIAKLADNVLVKIPCHVMYYPVIAKLVQEGIKINITLLFSLSQALCMSKLGVRYISAFVGRLDDNNEPGSQLLYDIRLMLTTYGYQTQLLAASIRHPQHVHDAIQAGADAITMPPDVLKAITSHTLTDQGIAKFEADWKKLGVSTFP